MPLNPENTNPTNKLLVFSHHKCATQWTIEILQRYAQPFGLSFGSSHLSHYWKLNHVNSYDILFLLDSDYTCPDFSNALLDRKAFHIIRNPLDIVVSAYYSHLSSHPLDGWPELNRQRDILRQLDKKAGMISTWTFLENSDFYCNGEMIGPLSSIRRWNYEDSRIKTIKMEDLVSNPSEILQFFPDNFQNQMLLQKIADQLTFENLSKGSQKSTIVESHHYRSGKKHQWLDEMDYSLAWSIYYKYQKIIDTYYPEVRMLLERNKLDPININRIKRRIQNMF